MTKQKPDGTVLLHEYNTQGRLAKSGNSRASIRCPGSSDRGTEFSRKLDAFGNVIREEWSNGLWQESDYDDWDRPLIRKLPDQSQIEYEYEGPFLKKITRISSEGKQLYSHAYDQYDEKGNLRLEKGLFLCTYDYDRTGRRVSQNSPYYNEATVYDPSGHLIQRGDRLYTYDATSQMTSESGRFSARYDAHYNLQVLNGESIAVDPLNQIEGLEYDLNGNLLKPGFVYDEFDQLIESTGEKHVYDALGRRIQRGQTSFIYIGDEEIGAFENGELKELKIPGFSTHVAIEIDCTPYAPIIDVQGVTRLLIDWETKEIFKENDCDAFGVGLSEDVPYAYSGKRYDSKTGLVYFGKRYYDSSLRRWLTPDPVGSSNHSNLYQYLFNNPYLYQDSNGEFAFAIPLLFWGAELAVPAISACVTAMIYGTAAGAVAYGGYKLVETFNDRGHSPMGDYYTGNLTSSPNSLNWTMKSGSVDPTLPANPDDLLKRPGWKETTHPEAGKKGHRTFENGKTGEKLRHDKGKPWETGHKAHDHYHRPNPNATGRHDARYYRWKRKSNKRSKRSIPYLFSRGDMVELIIIKKYLHEFHDGALLNIEHNGHTYIFTLESAEIDP